MGAALIAREGPARRKIHLAVLVDGRLDVDGVLRLARTAERGLFDLVLLDGRGGPDAFTVLSAAAAVTDRLGLVGTVDPAVDQPFSVARRLATLDHLSDGRSGWSVATPTNRPGGSPDRAAEFVAVVHAVMDSWLPGAVVADDEEGVYAIAGRIRTVEHAGTYFDVRGAATLPAGPQGRPILLQHGDSREPGGVVVTTDVAPTTGTARPAGTAPTTGTVRPAGREPGPLVLEVATVVLGLTGGDASAAGDGPHSAPRRFVGTAAHVADQIDRHVGSGSCDGLLLVPHGGLDEFVDTVVPLLQDRGVFRTGYEGRTLREHLGFN